MNQCVSPASKPLHKHRYWQNQNQAEIHGGVDSNRCEVMCDDMWNQSKKVLCIMNGEVGKDQEPNSN